MRTMTCRALSVMSYRRRPRQGAAARGVGGGGDGVRGGEGGVTDVVVRAVQHQTLETVG